MMDSEPNFLNQDDLLTEEERSIRQTAREFVDAEVKPLLQEAHRKERFPQELILKFGEMGFLGTNLSGYECLGLNDTAYGLIMQELERADSGIRSFCSVQGALAMFAIHRFGSEAQKQKFLPDMAKGKKIGSFALTEANAGSDPGSMSTQARKVEGGYLLNGSKMWITNGSIADVVVVWAKLEGRIYGFLVEKGSKGLDVKTMEGKFSLRVSTTSEMYFSDCFVPEENLLPEVNGLKGPLSCLSQARFGIIFGVIGAAQDCYLTALDYAQHREIFKKPLSHYQITQEKLANCCCEISKAQLLAIQLGRLKEKNKLKPEQISMGKMNNCRMALEVARTSREILGGNGIMDEYPVIRHMLNLETVNTYEGTEDVHRLVVGQAITGHSAFR